MKIDAFIDLSRLELDAQGKTDKQKEKAATDFEEIFARHLVKNLTKDSFKMADDNSAMRSSNNLYRAFITDTLAGELAAQRRLGMADLVTRYWDQMASSEKSNPKC